MAKGINKVILVGHLGQDPEVKYMPSGGAVANVSIATSDQWKDKQSGEMKDKTEWHRVVFFGRLAEIVGEYLKKGSQVYVEGRLQTRKWQDKNGADHYTTEIVASELQMLGGRGEGGGQHQSGRGSAQQAPQAQRAPAQQQGGYQPMPEDEFDSDVPF